VPLEQRIQKKACCTAQKIRPKGSKAGGYWAKGGRYAKKAMAKMN
jgi:hypothetical protein